MVKYDWMYVFLPFFLFAGTSTLPG